MKKYLYILFIVIGTLAAYPALAGKDHEDPGAPKKEGEEEEDEKFTEKEKIEGGLEIKLVRSHTLKRTLEARNYKIYVIDLRGPEKYREGHIKGAYNLKLEFINARNMKRIVQNKDDYIVFYADERESTEPTAAAIKAFGLGYTKIYKYYDGYRHWELRKYPREKGLSRESE